MDARRELFDFVLEQADKQPTCKKVRLYRALAEFAGGQKETEELNELADLLEEADRHCREFVFQFSYRKDGE